MIQMLAGISHLLFSADSTYNMSEEFISYKIREGDAEFASWQAEADGA